MNEELHENVANGGYVIDTQAVAAAMLTRERIRTAALGVLVAPEPVDRRTGGVLEEDPAAIGDAA